MDSPPGAPAIPGALVVRKTYDLVLWIVQKVEKFPKSYRFSVGQRLIDTAHLFAAAREPAWTKAPAA